MEFKARNTNDLQGPLYKRLDSHGYPVKTRNGPALRLPGVTTISLRHPWERVNFSPARDANPFFHLFEAMCMLAGDLGNNVPLLAYFAKNMMMFSDDGKRYNAFYGTRIRECNMELGDAQTIDQLNEIIKILKADPESRQAVVQIWDPLQDLGRSTKDKACNLCLIFEVCVANCHLNMTSFNRSNDAIWGGVTGANIVHLSFFQEYVACALGLKVGEWHHSSANLHVYTERDEKWGNLLKEGESEGGKLLYPDVHRLFDTGMQDDFDDANTNFIKHICHRVLAANGRQIWDAPGPHDEEIPRKLFAQDFIDKVAYPMTMAYICWKQKRKQFAYDWLKEVTPGDWALAGLCWFKRREGIKFSPHTFNTNDNDFIAAKS